MADSASYEPVLSLKATGVLVGFSRLKQRRVINLIYQIASYPSQFGDYSERDSAGRDIQFLLIGDFVIGFWADHAVKELRVVDIDEV